MIWIVGAIAYLILGLAILALLTRLADWIDDSVYPIIIVTWPAALMFTIIVTMCNLLEWLGKKVARCTGR